MNKRLARLLPLLGVLMALGLLLWAGNQAGRGAEIEEQLAYAAESINKTLPKLARKDVMMEGAYAQERAMVFMYRSLSVDALPEDHDQIIASEMRYTTNKACSESTSRGLMDAGATFSSVLVDVDGHQLYEVEVDSIACKRVGL